jgi:hypothetical protein
VPKSVVSVMTRDMSPLSLSRTDSDYDYGKYYENDSKYDGYLEKRFFYAAPGPVNAVRLAEDTSQSPTFHLQSQNGNERYRYNYLCDG